MKYSINYKLLLFIGYINRGRQELSVGIVYLEWTIFLVLDEVANSVNQERVPARLKRYLGTSGQVVYTIYTIVMLGRSLFVISVSGPFVRPTVDRYVFSLAFMFSTFFIGFL